SIDLGQEGGHTKRRIAHTGDSTGKTIQEKLIDQINQRNNIQVYEHHIAIDLVNINGQIAGAYVLNEKSDEIINFSAKITTIATGGVGKVFLFTSNPDSASGDGIAMAYRAGATISNMEFIQFHPTIFYHPNFRSFLITEALRGEGAVLLNEQKQTFLDNVHPQKELAPRDIISRAIDLEMKRSGSDYVYLDISFKDSQFIKNRFPTIYTTLLKYNVDITKQPIPVVPAAHYTIGGIRADINGKTDIQGLLAIGEVCYTGLHGANRLASNSLLEGGVMGIEAAKYTEELIQSGKVKLYSFPPWKVGDAIDSDEKVIVSHNWDELRRLMWSYVGIVRTTKRLLRAKERIEMLKHEIQDYYWDYKVKSDVIELRNLVQVAELIVNSALFRKESRGAHFTSDFPNTNGIARETLNQKNLGVFQSEIINPK
ncbi:MAG: L-aspartate oxidase, partial [Candidatus Heimdallarchaeota archaeon]|nr:L-aspartate oxidase [Candidatus Heimdallarchaeota archaeon]